MGQTRALKIGLEGRLKVRVDPKWKIMEWINEHSCTLINRGQAGKDGKTRYRRIVGKESSQPVVEMGEQVLVQPKRSPKTNRKQSLAARWKHGTWVGMTLNSNEHIIVIEGGEVAMRARTVKRKSMDLRWDHDAVSKITATPRYPNPRHHRRQSDQKMPLEEWW